MQVTLQEIEELKSFISMLNLQKNSIVVVEGKKDTQALRLIGFSGTVLESQRFGSFIKFVDFVANFQNVIILLDSDRKGKTITSRLIYQLQRRTNLDLTFKQKLIQITKGKIRHIEQLSCYQSFLI